MIWLDGGPSHFETFDPKPEAPEPTFAAFSRRCRRSVPGVHFSEPVSEAGRPVFDKFSVVRSISHKDPNHGGGNHYMMTGAPTPVPVGCGAFVTFHPSMGSMVSHRTRGAQRPASLHGHAFANTRSGGPNFLGGEHSRRSSSGGIPNSDAFRVHDVVLPGDLAEGRMKSRRELRSRARPDAAGRTTAWPRTLRWNSTSFTNRDSTWFPRRQAQAAFDMNREDPKVRERYGRNDMAQRFLLARRLVEVGVSWVTVNWGGWDHHTGIEAAYKGDHVENARPGRGGLVERPG